MIDLSMVPDWMRCTEKWRCKPSGQYMFEDQRWNLPVDTAIRTQRSKLVQFYFAHFRDGKTVEQACAISRFPLNLMVELVETFNRRKFTVNLEQHLVYFLYRSRLAGTEPVWNKLLDRNLLSTGLTRDRRYKFKCLVEDILEELDDLSKDEDANLSDGEQEDAARTRSIKRKSKIGEDEVRRIVAETFVHRRR
jgi:hypothetical protein